MGGRRRAEPVARRPSGKEAQEGGHQGVSAGEFELACVAMAMADRGRVCAGCPGGEGFRSHMVRLDLHEGAAAKGGTADPWEK